MEDVGYPPKPIRPQLPHLKANQIPSHAEKWWQLTILYVYCCLTLINHMLTERQVRELHSSFSASCLQCFYTNDSVSRPAEGGRLPNTCTMWPHLLLYVCSYTTIHQQLSECAYSLIKEKKQKWSYGLNNNAGILNPPPLNPLHYLLPGCVNMEPHERTHVLQSEWKALKVWVWLRQVLIHNVESCSDCSQQTCLHCPWNYTHVHGRHSQTKAKHTKWGQCDYISWWGTQQ